jgi:hypothetical protein
VLLNAFKKKGFNVVGIEPAKKLVKVANDLGINTYQGFLNKKISQKIILKEKKFDLIFSNNVLANVDDINGWVSNIKILLNFASLAVPFLCFDQPMVIKTIARILINGCSRTVSLKSAFFIAAPESCLNPFSETKYKIKPTTNCMCVAISPNNAIFLSLAVNSFLEDFPRNEFTTAKTNNNKAT